MPELAHLARQPELPDITAFDGGAHRAAFRQRWHANAGRRAFPQPRVSCVGVGHAAGRGTSQDGRFAGDDQRPDAGERAAGEYTEESSATEAAVHHRPVAPHAEGRADEFREIARLVHTG